MPSKVWIAAAVVGALAIGGAGVAVAASPQARTIRLNNPGALRKSGPPYWDGRIETTDKDLEAFSNAIYGARAMLLNMRRRYNEGNRTIRKLVNIWSGGENATGYANSVAAKVGISADAIFPWQANSAVQIAKAMSDWETGIPYFPQQLFVDAWGIM